MRPTSGVAFASNSWRSIPGIPEQFSTLAFLLLFEDQKVTFFPLSSGKNINEIHLSREGARKVII